MPFGSGEAGRGDEPKPDEFPASITHSFSGSDAHGWEVGVAGLTFDEAMAVMQEIVTQLRARRRTEAAGRAALSAVEGE